ncbi:MAG: GntR family transcriptional regulator [Clostridiales bacterium]|jgi:GntR family transcriptional regulator|nr:GntR family transcriptional regulator [Eubacteriales bacterium]MDH7565460.1 GntR family transcriptional regulator [Clostridiales bacterium]
MKTSESFIPIYFKLAEDIKQQVFSGKLKPGDMLPTEAQLCSQYGISRMTARQGLKLLVDEGMVESFRGKGSFVAQPKFNQLMLELPDSHFHLQENASVQLLGVDIIPADSTVASVLKLKTNSKVIRIKKLYLTENEPVALDTRYIIYHRRQPVVENEINYAAFPKEVARHTGVALIRNQVTFSAVPLDKNLAQQLGTTEGKPALQIEQLVFGGQEQPLGWSIIICNGEKYRMNAITKTYI